MPIWEIPGISIPKFLKNWRSFASQQLAYWFGTYLWYQWVYRGIEGLAYLTSASRRGCHMMGYKMVVIRMRIGRCGLFLCLTYASWQILIFHDRWLYNMTWTFQILFKKFRTWITLVNDIFHKDIIKYYCR